MHYKPIIQNIWWRIAVALIAGFMMELLTDNILALMYTKYNVFDSGSRFFINLVFTFIPFQLFYYSNLLLDKRLDWNEKTQTRFWVQLTAHLLITILFYLIPVYLIAYFFFGNTFFVLQIVLIHVFVVLTVIVLYNLNELGYFLLYKWRFSLGELDRFKKENVEFRFETLKNQVNPHFLFNSLNTLSSLVYENQDTAAQYIRELAKVYRYVLENRDKEMVKLRTDFDFIKSFIYLYELRFANMLKFDIDIADKKMDCFIAPMTIQMLIENAAKHNIVSRKKPLTISIKSTVDSIIVSNNLQKKQQKEYSSGIGLKNIKSRYSFITEREVVVVETEDEFIVEIPLISRQ